MEFLMMRHRYFASALIAAVVGAALLHVGKTAALGQGAEGVQVVSAAPDVPVHNPMLPEGAPPPRNADGHADLNGMWDYATSTPVQRRGEKLFLDAEEAAAMHQARVEGFNPDVRSDNVEYDAYSLGVNLAWFDYHAPLAQNRASLIVDPPNGQIPPFTPEAEAQMIRCTGIGYCGAQMQSPRDAYHPAEDETIADHITDRSLTERCMVVRNGPPMESTAWNNNIHILHREDFVVLHTEMIHTARVVWLDGRPRPDPSVKLWHGYSLGHWEGDTLVVETTNFHPNATWLGVLDREAFTLVERFTRIDADTVMYEYTMNAPETWTQPWTVQLPMKRLDGLMYEYACHEGNYGVKFQLMAARSKEQ